MINNKNFAIIGSGTGASTLVEIQLNKPQEQLLIVEDADNAQKEKLEMGIGIKNYRPLPPAEEGVIIHDTTPFQKKQHKPNSGFQLGSYKYKSK